MLMMPGSSILTYKGKTPKLASRVFLATSAHLIGDLEVGEDSSFWFNTVTRADCNYIRIGSRTNVQDGTVIHVTNSIFPTFIGNNVSIGHGVIIHGCKIADNCLIGMGAIILDGVEIGENCIVAAGSLIPPGKKFGSNSMILGSPARAIRSLTQDEHATLERTTNYYLEYKTNYESTASC